MGTSNSRSKCKPFSMGALKTKNRYTVLRMQLVLLAICVLGVSARPRPNFKVGDEVQCTAPFCDASCITSEEELGYELQEGARYKVTKVWKGVNGWRFDLKPLIAGPRLIGALPFARRWKVITRRRRLSTMER